MRLALVIEYDGASYHGFQYQVNAPSIQEEIEKAIARFTGERSRIVGAGRTDTGVHAKAQVVAFDTGTSRPLASFVKGLNFYLPDDIAVKAAYRTGGDFDPRRMAISRRYRYTIDAGPAPSPLTRRTAYHSGVSLDICGMQRAAGWFVGVHDFARFAGPLSEPHAGTVREIYEARVLREDDIINFEVEGSSFLPRQVRRMAGALVDLGRGSLTPAELRLMIDGVAGDAVARSLPPQGLCLMKVTYAHFPPEVRKSDGKLH
jgi:tRNA pseudouridine38-40 synthase